MKMHFRASLKEFFIIMIGTFQERKNRTYLAVKRENIKSMLYNILVNLDSKLHSGRCAILSQVICNTKFSRKYGIDIGHSPAVGDVKKIYGGYCMRIL